MPFISSLLIPWLNYCIFLRMFNIFFSIIKRNLLKIYSKIIDLSISSYNARNFSYHSSSILRCTFPPPHILLILLLGYISQLKYLVTAFWPGESVELSLPDMDQLRHSYSYCHHFIWIMGLLVHHVWNLMTILHCQQYYINSAMEIKSCVHSMYKKRAAGQKHLNDVEWNNYNSFFKTATRDFMK